VYLLCNEHAVYRVSLICDGYYENYSGSTEIRQNAGKTRFTFSQGIESGIVRSNFSLFNLNILLLGVPKRKDVTGEWRNLFLNSTHLQGMWHAWDRGEKCTKFWWGSPKERDHSENQGVEGRMGSEWISGGVV
jgi:hypothetical protein